MKLASSFRDPCGFVFTQEGNLYRHIAASYKVHYEHLHQSGLYEELTREGLLIPHEEMSQPENFSSGAWKVIKPRKIPFISYSYEWCFGQLRDAALQILNIQERALKKGMILKDAAAFNIQFCGTKPLWIDTLSFEIYDGQPWIAYQQFCRHFLAPLALGVFQDVRLLRNAELFPDGIPLDYASNLLPLRSWLNPKLLFHIQGNARTLAFSSQEPQAETSQSSLGMKGLSRILSHLKNSIESLSWNPKRTAWSDYHPEKHYGMQGMQEKQNIVEEYLKQIKPKNVWDLGANTGVFSEIASRNVNFVLALDSDFSAVQRHWDQLKQKKSETIFPLVIDLSQPTSGRGWENQERMSLLSRGPADTALALGLIHHLNLAAGIPFERIAAFLASLCKHLIIEFVPVSDPKVQEMIKNKRALSQEKIYSKEAFEAHFQDAFRILERRDVKGTERILYRMEKMT